jgi:hypothetical protein
MFIRLYDAAKTIGDIETMEFCTKILQVFEENGVNGFSNVKLLKDHTLLTTCINLFYHAIFENNHELPQPSSLLYWQSPVSVLSTN